MNVIPFRRKQQPVPREVHVTENDKSIDLPEGAQGDELLIDRYHNFFAVPANVHFKRISISRCDNFREIGPGLSCDHLTIEDCPAFEGFSTTARICDKLTVTNCSEFKFLPPELNTGTLIVRNCPSFEEIAEGIDCHFLNISDCAKFKRWPRKGAIKFGHLIARNCSQLTYIPDWIGPLARLDLRNCREIKNLPEGLQVTSWIDVANTGITQLPQSMQRSFVRWQGVSVEPRIAFAPETITVAEILNEANVEVRRVMIQRMGYQRFISEAGAETLDTDRDAGGERRLFRVGIENDEDLVCVSVICPSTGNQYMLRVPPSIKTCKQAVAWIAGFDHPDEYKLSAES